MAVITTQLITTRLQIANCCAATKGYNYLLSCEEGTNNKSDLEEIELLVDLIDIMLPYTKSITNTCITTAQMNNILDKLCSICDEPCTNYVNF